LIGGERFLDFFRKATTNTPAQFRRLLQAEIAKWGAVVKFANVKPD
jgi:hypothetical protein